MTIPFRELIQEAVKAPSGHNTQPWKFGIQEQVITIYPDYERALPVVDADNHALFISLGCALENLVIAAEQFGFRTETTLDVEQANKECIHVQFFPSRTSKDESLYPFINERQATRNRYNGSPIPIGDIEKLKAASIQEEVKTILLTDKKEFKPIIDFVKEGSRLQFSNPAFMEELIKWIRFNKATATDKGDGLFAAATGNPSVPTWFGKIFMKVSSNPQKEADKWVGLINSSSALMIFIARNNEKKAWINVGRSFERTMLLATSLNIHHAHVNMPCEEWEVRNKMIDYLHLTHGEQPLLLIRLGYSDKMPYSFRRPLEDVIVSDTNKLDSVFKIA